MKKALLDENSLVQNVIEYSDRGIVGRFPLGYSMVECTNIPVDIGDYFNTEDGKFYRDETPVERIPTEEEKIYELQTRAEETEAALVELAALIGG